MLIPSRDALRLQLAAFGGADPGAFLEVRCLRPDGTPGPRGFMPVAERDQAVQAVLMLGQRKLHVYISAAPRVRRRGRAEDVESVHSFWADCDDPRAIEKLRRFRPLPSLVWWTSPDRLQAAWALREPVPPAWARRANRRLAHALGADLAATDCARVLRAIGSRNVKHARPFQVSCARCEPTVFTAAEVVGDLPDPPTLPVRVPTACQPGSSSQALAGLVRTVAQAAPGGRNHALFWAAARAGERIYAGSLDEREAVEQLCAAAQNAGLGEAEITATIRSALRTSATVAA